MQRTILVTGSTDGIGKQTAADLLQLGHNVIIHGRNKENCLATIKYLKRLNNVGEQDNWRSEYVVSDFNSLEDVRKMCIEINERFDCIDTLVNNAGVYTNKKLVTVDGFESTFQINHLAPFLLTLGILEKIRKSEAGRIVNVSSIAHANAEWDVENMNGEKSFSGYGVYSFSKLANVLFTYYLAEKLKGTKIMANCLHPGVISTKLLHKGFNIEGNDLGEGSKTSVYLAQSEEVNNVTGKYFIDKVAKESSRVSYSVENQMLLWQISEKFTKSTFKI